MPAPLLTLDIHDRRLLQLLLADFSDEEIARQIFVSVRTVRRRLHDLMDRVGADNRFMLGALAAHHGWIDPSQTARARGRVTAA
jgi:DNA-binding NarL/FixJ family response regulator